MSSEAAGYFPRVVGTAAETDQTEFRSVPDGRLETESAAFSSFRADQIDAAEAEPRLGMDIPDEHLLARVAENDREALSLLFRRYATVIRILGERILRDAAEAEDLVQEVFLFIFRKAALFDPSRGSARSWLLHVTYHRAFDRRRYLVSRRFYANLELQEAILEAREPVALSTFYDDTIEAALGRDALRRIEEVLSEVQRRVLRLRFVDGYTMHEIAAILGQSVGNVSNHYYRALEKMRKEFFTAELQGK